MKPKIIRTEEEYEAALEHIESLFDAEPGSVEEEEFELFSLIIEKYEDEHYSIELPSPIEAIKFRMDQQDLKQKDLVPFIGSQSKVSAVLNGQRELSKEMIRRLHTGLGIPFNVLIQKQNAKYEEQEYFIEDFPFNEMVRQGYFESYNDVRRAKGMAEELLEKLFLIFGDHPPVAIYCRHADKETNQNALLAWQAHVLEIISSEELSPFDISKLEKTFYADLLKFSAYQAGLQLVKEHLNKTGIHFAILPHLPKTYLDGAAFIAPDGNPVIALTLRHDRLDNFWFTLMHELAHVALHLNDGSRAYFDEIEGNTMEESIEEQEANAFAREKLIPQNFWQTQIAANLDFLDEVHLDRFAIELNISPAILAGRIRYELNDYSCFSNRVGNHEVRKQFSGHYF